MLVFAPMGAWAMAVEVPWSGIYVAGLVLAGPGIAVSLWCFHRTAGWGAGMAVLGCAWILVMPWAVMFGTDAITDGIHGRMHAYGYGQLLLRLWLPGLLVPALPAVILSWVVSRLQRGAQGVSRNGAGTR